MILGSADLNAATETLLYEPVAGREAVVRLIVTNRNGIQILVHVVHRVGAGPTTAADYLAFNYPIPANESRVSRVFDVREGEQVLVQSDTSGVTVAANGIERNT